MGKHLGFSRLDYLFSTNMNQELKMRVYIVGSFVFSTIYKSGFPPPSHGFPVESLGCSTRSKVLKDGDDITLTHQGKYTEEAGRWQKCTQWTGTVVEANVPTSASPTKKCWLRGCLWQMAA